MSRHYGLSCTLHLSCSTMQRKENTWQPHGLSLWTSDTTLGRGLVFVTTDLVHQVAVSLRFPSFQRQDCGTSFRGKPPITWYLEAAVNFKMQSVWNAVELRGFPCWALPAFCLRTTRFLWAKESSAAELPAECW